MKMRNEMSSIAARLAADIGLERVYGTGDHSSDVVIPNDTDMHNAVNAEPGLVDQFNHKTAAFRAISEDTMKLSSAAQVMPALKWKNSARFGELDADAQWFSMLKSTRMGKFGRQRVAAWEGTKPANGSRDTEGNGSNCRWACITGGRRRTQTFY